MFCSYDWGIRWLGKKLRNLFMRQTKCLTDALTIVELSPNDKIKAFRGRIKPNVLVYMHWDRVVVFLFHLVSSWVSWARKSGSRCGLDTSQGCRRQSFVSLRTACTEKRSYNSLTIPCRVLSQSVFRTCRNLGKGFP